MNKADLKIDWATHAAAKYACEHWHYSKCVPAGKLAKIGVWESTKFVGCVVFGRGATPNLCKPYGIGQDQCVELVRIALTKHKCAVSRVVALSIKFLHKSNPKLRLIVSFADTSQGHHGGIYQAGNWLYSGQSEKGNFFLVHGKLMHPRSVISKGGENSIRGAKKIDPNATVVVVPGKHRYLMPLDDDMRKKIEPLRKPYPKRVRSVDSDTSTDQVEKGGASPTRTLQSETM